MDIGTAKPTIEERGGVAHHLIDILDPSQAFSTGQFRSQALTLMEAISARGKIPLLVGGTMLYFNALAKGLATLPSADAALRIRLDQEFAELGKEAMHRKLLAIDPEAATRIHPNDPQRVQRALEVFELTGKPLTELFKEAQHQTIPYQLTKLVIAPKDRRILHDIIAVRFKKMIAQGLIEEVQKLYDRGDLSEQMPSIRAVGYRQVWSYLQGEYDEQVMIEKGIVATRQLAKRQFTWLRRESNAHWLTTGTENIMANSLKILASNHIL